MSGHMKLVFLCSILIVSLSTVAAFYATAVTRKETYNATRDITSAITKSWLEQILGKDVASFVASSATDVGQYFASALVTVEVTMSDGETRYLFVKMFPVEGALAPNISKSNLFWTEVQCYKVLIPELGRVLSNIINNKIADTADCQPGIFLPFAPLIFGTAVDYWGSGQELEGVKANPLDNCLVLPDLKKEGGFRQKDRLTGIDDLKHYELIIEAQATIHAVSWGYKTVMGLERLSDKFSFLNFGKSNCARTRNSSLSAKILMGNNLKLYQRAINDVLHENDPMKGTLLESLLKAYNHIDDIESLYLCQELPLPDPEVTKDTILRIPLTPAKEVEVPWLVLNHGDPHIGNWMFRYDAQGKPTQVLFIDLQNVVEKDLISELVHSLYLNTDSSFRRKYATQLLQKYYQKFQTVCNELRVTPPEDFGLEELNRRFHRAKIWGFYKAFRSLPIILNPKVEVNLLSAETISNEDQIRKTVSKLTGDGRNGPFQHWAVQLLFELYDDGVI